MGFAATFALTVALGGSLAHAARRDVLARLREQGTSRLDAELVGIRPSRTHGVRLKYRVRGCYDVKQVEWRLRPFREVVREEGRGPRASLAR